MGLRSMGIRWLTLTVIALAGFTVSHAKDPANASGESEPKTKPDQPVMVEMDTSEGQIVFELLPEKAPVTVANFLEYVDSGHYDKTVFHRVIADFMIQGGGMDKNLREKKTRPQIRNEASNGLKNEKYTIAMARELSNPHSATCQFFINTSDNDFLDRNESLGNAGHAVFGRVVKGFDVVDKIGGVQTYARPRPDFPAMLMRYVPKTPVFINRVARIDRSGE